MFPCPTPINSTAPLLSVFTKCVLENLVILAPGLLGGSVARAAHARGLAHRITVWARRPDARLKLREQPWVNHVAESAADAVRERGALIGAALTVVRLLKCTPLHPGGHDPVPPRRTPRCTRITA